MGVANLLNFMIKIYVWVHHDSEMTYIVSGGALNSTHSLTCAHKLA